MKLWSGKDCEMMKSLWRAGYTGQQIADHFGVTRSTALGKLFRLGMMKKGRNAKAVPSEKSGTIAACA